MQCRRYFPPEYVARGRRSQTFDIFSFGVVMLELAAGRRAYGNIDSMTREQYIDEVRDAFSFSKTTDTF